MNESALLLVLPRRGRYYITTLRLNFSPVRGSILMQFRLLESPDFILLAIELSLKSARFLAMPRRGRYYIPLKLNFSPIHGSILMRFRLLDIYFATV